MFTTYQVTTQTASVVAVAFLLSYALARLVFGFLSDRMPLKMLFLFLCSAQVGCLLGLACCFRATTTRCCSS